MPMNFLRISSITSQAERAWLFLSYLYQARDNMVEYKGETLLYAAVKTYSERYDFFYHLLTKPLLNSVVLRLSDGTNDGVLDALTLPLCGCRNCHAEKMHQGIFFCMAMGPLSKKSAENRIINT